MEIKSFPGTTFFDRLFEVDDHKLDQTESVMLRLKSAFQSVDWVYVCVNLIARECSSLTPKVYLETIEQGKKVYQLQENHPVQKMLEKPTLKDDSAHFYYSLFGDLSLSGNTFCYTDNQFLKMYYIPSELVSITDGHYYVNGRKVDLLHIRLPSLTLSPWGLSPFLAGVPAIEFNQFSQKYLNDFFKKGSTPQMILETEVAGNLETLAYLKKTFDDNYTGQRNSRKTLVLPKGVKANAHMDKMADDKLVQLLEHNRERIISLLGVPKHALSLQTAGSLGSEEHKQALKYFWQSTIIPFTRKVATALTSAFQRELGQGFCIDYDYSDVAILKDDQVQKAQLATLLLSTKTLNEVRKELWELEPVEGGDVVQGYQQRQQISPLQEQPQEVIEEIYPPTELTFENSLQEKLTPEKHPMFAQCFGEHCDLIKAESKEDTFKNYIFDFFEAQLKQVITLLKKKQKADLPTNRTIKDALFELEDDFINNYNSFLQPNLSLGYRSQLKLIFNEKDRTAIELLRARTAKNEVALLNARGLSNFAQLTKTTSKSIMDIIATGKESNLSVTDIANNIIDKMGNDFAKRAATIARTETLTAVSIGQAGAMENAKEVIPDLVKFWITADDERVRGRPDGIYPDAKFDHWELHGTIAEPNEKFKNGLLYPRDTNGDAGNVINCLVGDSFVSANNIKKIYRRIYNGDIISIKTASGKVLSVTPNHPILTSDGWRSAAQITKSQKLVHCTFGNKFFFNSDNLNIVPAKIHEVFDSLSEFGVVAHSAGANFHGDITNGNVDVIDVDRILRDGIKSKFSECLNNINLKHADFASSNELSFCGVNKSLSLSGFSCGSEMTISNLVNPLLFTHSAPFNSFGLRGASDSNTSDFKVPHNNNSWDIEHFRDFIHASNVVDVLFDPIVDVDVSVFASHVYNLETKNNLYIANNFINHNCRCTFSLISRKDVNDFL